VRVRELDELIEVEVRNNGRSFPTAVTSDGTGLRMLERQVASLKGELNALDVRRGAAFRLRFPAH
jgi:signal transduction histidine kinase